MDNLLQTMTFLEELHPEVVQKSQLVLLCQDQCDPIDNHFQAYKHINLNLDCMHLPYLTNVGVDHALSENLIILESDRIVPPGYFKKTIDALQDGIVISPKQIMKLEEAVENEEIRNIIAGKLIHPHHIDHKSMTGEPGFRNAFSGNTAITKHDYVSIGKMDEFYRGYGWADTDMTHTVLGAGIDIILYDETEIHLYHPGIHYGNNNDFLANGIYCCRKWKIPMPHELQEETAKQMRLLL